MRKKEAKNARLPRTVTPNHYTLNFVPNFSNLTFTGHAVVELEVVETTNQIIFNSKGLTISYSHYEGESPAIIYNEQQEIVIFEFSTELQCGKGQLFLEFSGKLASDMLGLYHSTYTDTNETNFDILATQFESVFARRAFPCMDEPDRKATFEISIVALDNQVALSNMPEICRNIIPTPKGCIEPPNGHNYVMISFDCTPRMSTYLVAMIVGNFEYISSIVPVSGTTSASSFSKSEKGNSVKSQANAVEVRVYTPPGKRNLGQHALKVVQKLLPFYSELFGSSYPLPKLDLVAIPDFSCNAMENWGLIIFREAALLLDLENSPLFSQQSVALTVAHEVSHMWFGNLVTMSWWTDLWLNEGFATWAQYLAIDHCFPEFDAWTAFVTDSYNLARRLDELTSSHPIEVEVNSGQEVEEIFDAVSYQKGSCVIRMLYNYMGAHVSIVECLLLIRYLILLPRFHEGLRAYLEKFKYSNATTQDLWAVMEATGVDNLTELMSMWTRQTGYPVVSTRLIRAHDGTYSVGVKQQRFLADSSSAANEPPVRWHIPLTVCAMDDSNNTLLNVITYASNQSLSSTEDPDNSVQDQPSAKTELESQELIFALPVSLRNPQVRLNPDAFGFYRVHYDSVMMDAIIEAISHGDVPERDRIALLDDQFALARAGFQGLDKVLQFCLAFVGEEKHSVWSVLSAGLADIESLLEEASYPAGDKIVSPEPSKEIRALHRLYLELALPMYEEIGFMPAPSDSNNVRLVRPIIISILGRAGYKDVIEKARIAFERQYSVLTFTPAGQPVKDPSKLIPPDLRAAIYTIYVRNGEDVEFWRLVELYHQTILSDERVRILSSIGVVTNERVLDFLMEFTFSEDVRRQDRFHALLGLVRTPAGRRFLWDFVRSQFRLLIEELGTSHLLAKVLMASGANFASQKYYKEIKGFYQNRTLPCRRAIQQTLELLRIRIDQLNRDGLAVSTFLSSLADNDENTSLAQHLHTKRRRLGPTQVVSEQNLQ